MSDSNADNLKVFEERIRRIEGAKRSSGRTTYKRTGEFYRKNEERQRRKKKERKANWPFRILLVVAAVLGVKTYIIADMGPDAYALRMVELQSGSQYEQWAAIALQPDPVTTFLQQVLWDKGVVTQPSDPVAVAPIPEAADELVPDTEGASTVDTVPAPEVVGDTNASN